MKRKIHDYQGDGIVVEFEPKRCIHAAECVGGLPEVFDPQRRPWVEPTRATTVAVAEVVCECPTGALTYRRTDGGEAEEPADSNTARVAPDGPLFVRGRIRIEMPDGDVVEANRVALCRCGASANKPFCDNSHLDSGFTDPSEELSGRLRPVEAGQGPAVVFRLAANGPVLVDGPLTVVAAGGDSLEGGRGALCRCGLSDTKPFCDGSHKDSDFVAD